MNTTIRRLKASGVMVGSTLQLGNVHFDFVRLTKSNGPIGPLARELPSCKPFCGKKEVCM